jgi:hypothetical protein
MDRSRGIDKGGKFMRKALDEEWRVWCGNNECPSHAVSIDGKHLCLLVYENCGKDIRSCKPEECCKCYCKERNCRRRLRDGGEEDKNDSVCRSS